MFNPIEALVRAVEPRSLAHSDPIVGSAVLARDVTAPDELAVAPVGAPSSDDIVAPAAAKRTATIDTPAAPVAHPPGRTWHLE